MNAAAESAEAAVRRGGYIDAGAATVWWSRHYIAPMALLFGAASLSFFIKWKHARFLHWFSVILVALPALLLVMMIVKELAEGYGT
jgi:hypothetical protein